jgi:flagellar FliJ protein
MKGIATLVRVYRMRLNDARRGLADLFREKEGILAECDRIAGEVEAERIIAAGSLEAGTAFARYRGAMIMRREALNPLIADVDRRIAEVNEHIAVLFRELKKYELTLEQREQEKAREEERREQLLLDELGLEMFRRREAGQA